MADRVLTADEQRFIRHYARQGFVPEGISTAERMARIKRGEGNTILKRAHVQEEIARRKLLLEMEQAKLDAQDLNRKEDAIETLVRITMEEAEHELRKLVKLDAAAFGPIKLKAIQTALVYTGAIRQGSTERLAPIDQSASGTLGGREDSFYTATFDRIRASEAAQLEAVAEILPAEPEPPSKPQAAPAAEEPPPPPPEDPRKAAKARREVRTVEMQ
jgi:hypothetical protein